MMAHEYGHHLYNNIADKSQTMAIAGARGTRHGAVDFEKVDRLSRGSVNEGFADIMAFYAGGENTELFVAPFTERSPLVNYIKGWRKSITESVLDQLFNQGTGVFSDIHYVGAIFATAAHELASTKFDNTKDKGNLLVEWMKAERACSFSVENSAVLACLAANLVHQVQASALLYRWNF